MKRSRKRLTITPRTHAKSAATAPVLEPSAPATGELRTNWRLLLGTLICVAIVAGVASLVHRWQVGGVADALLSRAELHRKNEDWQFAAATYHRFLQLRPSDSAAKVRLAECFDKANPGPQQRERVIDLYYQATSGAPENTSIRLRLAEKLLELRRFTPAFEQAQKVLASQATDAAALRYSAFAQDAIRQQQSRPLDEKTRAAFTAALAADPTHVELVATVAESLRREGERLRRVDDLEAADRAFDELLTANPQNVSAWLARHRYRRQHQQQGADADLQQAQALAPQNPYVLLATADFALANRKWQAAIDACQQLAKQAKTNPLMHRIWGDALLGLGRTSDAIAQWKTGLTSAPGTAADFQLRLAAAYLALKQPQDAAALLDQLEVFAERSTFDGSHSVFAPMRSTVQMLRANWHLQRNEWSKAAPLFKSIALAAPSEARGQEDLLRRVDARRMLAERELQLERYDLAAEHFEHALTLQPTNAKLRVATAQAYTAAGHWSEALRHVSFALAREPQLTEALLLQAHLRIAIESRLPVADRNWNECSELITQAERLLPDDFRVSLLKVAFLLGKAPQASREQAREVLQALAAKHPDAAQLQASLVMPLEQLGDSAGADAALQNWLRLAGETVALRLRRAELNLNRRQLANARQELLAIEPQLSLSERHRVARLWLRLESQAGSPAAAQHAWQRLAKAAPDDPHLVLLLADFALRDPQAAVEQYEEQLRTIEGASGSAWRYVRARRLMSAREVTPAAKSEALELSQWLTKHRPGWPQSWILSGVMAEQQRDWDKAIAAYQQVVLIDGTQLPVYERLLRILYQQGRFSEVDRFVAALSAQGRLSPESSLIAIGSAAAQQELDLAFQLAQEAAKASPGNVPATLWLAHLQQVRGEIAEAEATIAELLKRAPQDERAWGGRLALLQSRGERPRFAAALQECEACNELATKPKALLLAQGYGLLGYPERAATYYQQAIDAGQQDASTQLQLATAQLQFDPAQAEKTLRALRVKQPESAAARRMLAVTLAARRQQALWPEIQELLQADGASQTSEDLRLQAMLRLQAQKPDEVAHTRKLFEQLVAQSNRPVAQDRQLLAMLYEQEGNAAKARQQYETLASDSAATPEHLMMLIAFSLRQRDTDTAAVWLKRLERREIDVWIIRRLQAQIHHIAERQAELTSFLNELESTNRGSASNLKDVVAYHTNMAQLYAAIDITTDVERHLRALCSADAQQSPLLVTWLLRQQRAGDALTVALAECDRETTAANVTLLAQVMPLVTDSGEAAQRGERILLKCATESHDASILAAISNLRLQQHRPEEAIAILRRLVTLAPDDVLSLNNLAALLADRDGEQENALRYIDKAIASSPRPQPFMLDTRAKVLLHHNRVQEALAVLENVVARWPNTDARVYLHLSFAYDRQGQRSQAREALAEARKRGLQVRDLTPGDRLQLDELDGRLASLDRSTEAKQNEEATP